MDEGRARGAGPLATAVGFVALGSVACLATYFAVGGPFGWINDLGNAATGMLSAALAWQLRGRLPDRTRGPAVGTALVGAAVTMVGSALVLSGTTGFLLAGLVSSLGFAGVGAWLMILNRSADGAAGTARLRTLGLAAGALMALGVLVAPGIALGIDDMATAPGWIWIGFVGWLGIYAAYPAWAILTGVSESRRVGVAVRSEAGSTS